MKFCIPVEFKYFLNLYTRKNNLQANIFIRTHRPTPWRTRRRVERKMEAAASATGPWCNNNMEIDTGDVVSHISCWTHGYTEGKALFLLCLRHRAKSLSVIAKHSDPDTTMKLPPTLRIWKKTLPLSWLSVCHVHSDLQYFLTYRNFLPICILYYTCYTKHLEIFLALNEMRLLRLHYGYT